MNWLRNFVIDLSDIYGRGLPGMIVLLNFYYLLKECFSFNLLNEFKISTFAEHNLFWGVLAFAVVSFLLGHIPLFISHGIDNWRRKRAPLFSEHDAPNKKRFADPTSEGRVREYFRQEFRPKFLEKGNTEILGYMMHSLVNSRPDLYEAIRGHEAQRNLRGGTGVSLIMSAVVFIFVPVSPQWLYSATTVLAIGIIGIIFLLVGMRSAVGCDEMTMRLYFFSKTEPRQPSEDKGK